MLALSLALAMFATASGSSLVLPLSYDMEYDGQLRYFDARLPPDYDKNSPAPLLLVLHAGAGSASRMEYISGWTEVGIARGYIVVYPEGVDGDWNDGRNVRYTRAAREHVDDVGFLNEVIARMSERYSIDPARIYLTGYGSGGMMALRYACAESAKLAAVAVLDATLPQEAAQWCEVRSPVPAMFMVQKGSPFVPFDGGEIKVMSLKRGKVLSARESAAVWAKGNGCEEEAMEQATQSGVLESWSFGGCESTEPVKLLALEGAELDFPGGRRGWIAQQFTRARRGFDTVTEMAHFFQEQGAKSSKGS